MKKLVFIFVAISSIILLPSSILKATCPAGFTATTDVVLVGPSDPCPTGFAIATGVSHTHFIPIVGDASRGSWGNNFTCTAGGTNSLTRVCRRS